MVKAMYCSGFIIDQSPDPISNEFKLVRIILVISEFANPDVISEW